MLAFAQSIRSGPDRGPVTNCDRLASLKDLGKKHFAFTRLDADAGSRYTGSSLAALYAEAVKKENAS